MSQAMSISPNDLAAINTLTQVIVPRIITRLKAAEADLVLTQERVKTLEEQVRVLGSTAAAKQVETKTRKKGKTPEVPELRPETASTSSEYISFTEILEAEKSAGSVPSDEHLAKLSGQAKKKHIGPVQVTPEEKVELQGKALAHIATLPDALPAATPDGQPVEVDGILINGDAVVAIQWCARQKPVMTVEDIVAKLQCSENAVRYLLKIGPDTQAEICRLFPPAQYY